jgi:hypothetical protein
MNPIVWGWLVCVLACLFAIELCVRPVIPAMALALVATK